MGKLPVHKDLMQNMQQEIENNDKITAQTGQKSAFIEPYDWRFCRRLHAQYNVIAIPASPFFSRSDYSTHYNLPPLARFAFCKRDETLVEATRRLTENHKYFELYSEK